MNYKTLLLNGLIVCSVLPCFAAQEAQDVGWKNHEVPDDLESGQFYNSKTLDMGAMVWSMALSPDKRLLGVGGEGQAIVDMGKGKIIRRSRIKKQIKSLSWLHNVPCIMAASGGDIGIVDLLSGLVVQKLKGHNDSVSSVAISLDDTKIVSGSDDKTLMIYYRVSGKRTQILKGHRMDVKSVAMSSDNTKIFSGSCDGTVKVWEKK